MPVLKVPVTDEIYGALLEDANLHLRTPPLHAAAILRAALGLPVPVTAMSGLVPFLSAEVLERASSKRESNAD